MIISINAEKAFDKIQHPFMIKTLRNIEIDRNTLTLVKKQEMHVFSKLDQTLDKKTMISKRGLTYPQLVIEWNLYKTLTLTISQ